MRVLPTAVAGLAVLTVTACSSAPPQTPDTQPLGNVTAAPQECGLISAQAIQIAVGFGDYTANGTKMDMGKRFKSCTVAKRPVDAQGARLSIQFFDPSLSTAQDLENDKASRAGEDLPDGLGPGYVTPIKESGKVVGARAFAWTADGGRLLSVNIRHGSSRRDPGADAVEFLRQLRPILLK
ncbi:hypothetical protein [Nonomuraea rhizosphaerae]|uniref:hypothetical protein n=1 Tax=Nonomuraea rhizosphaerae TaxID=2665663 RepID=UPI001C606134|nr:hypothetical protein [Nonomuraea rhizosphaerae]